MAGMKKEIAAGIILALLFAGAIVNIHYVDKLSQGLIAQVEDARGMAGAGDYQAAQKVLAGAIYQWMDADSYTHIFIRHPEIDSTTDAFYELLDSVSAGDIKTAQGAFEKVEAHLASIAGMEHITIGSIF